MEGQIKGGLDRWSTLTKEIMKQREFGTDHPGYR